MASYTIGLDFGTNSVRVLLVNTQNGMETGNAVFDYPSGEGGILLDKKDHNLARQSPADYLQGMEQAIPEALKQAKQKDGVSESEIVGIGLDTTGSTPIPVDKDNKPMCFYPEFKNNLNAYAWLWKDHASLKEAHYLTELALQLRPQYLKKYGGVYSSEWYWSKLLHCLNTDPKLFHATHAWLELEDYIPAVLCGIKKPEEIVRGKCAAGHKAMYNETWGGMPDEEFLGALDPYLVEQRRRMPEKAVPIDHRAGLLCKDWAKKLGLPPGIPVAVGAFDAHLGAVGSGITPGTLVKIVGTSTCDIMVVPKDKDISDIPGVCGIVDGSVLPGYMAIEAGQSAVGDIFRWFVKDVCLGDDSLQVELTEQAKKLRPGQSGLMALDWNNGNRTILVDPQLTGLIVGLTLHSSRAEIYRALLEGTAFGALAIINRIEEYNIPIKQIICCGGISEKNDLFMQLYADILNRPIYLSRSSQTCALGAAIAGAVAAGAYNSVEAAMDAMTGVKKQAFYPDADNAGVYKDLYQQYKRLHDAFGWSDEVPVNKVMKDLLAIRDRATSTTGDD